MVNFMSCAFYCNDNKQRRKSGRTRRRVAEETESPGRRGHSSGCAERATSPGNPACTEGLCPHLHGVGQGTMTALLTGTVHWSPESHMPRGWGWRRGGHAGCSGGHLGQSSYDTRKQLLEKASVPAYALGRRSGVGGWGGWRELTALHCRRTSRSLS